VTARPLRLAEGGRYHGGAADAGRAVPASAARQPGSWSWKAVPRAAGCTPRGRRRQKRPAVTLAAGPPPAASQAWVTAASGAGGRSSEAPGPPILAGIQPGSTALDSTAGQRRAAGGGERENHAEQPCRRSIPPFHAPGSTAGPAGPRRRRGACDGEILASELRCRPWRCTAMVKAVQALHYVEHDPFTVLRAA